MMYCGYRRKCKQSAFTAARPNGTYDPNENLWVCTDCLMPSRMFFEAATDMLAPVGATGILSVYSQNDGISIIKWAGQNSGDRLVSMTYKPYPRTVGMPVDQGRSHLVEIWTKLDEAIHIVKDPIDGVAADVYKTKATTLAEVIALLMPAFYDSPTDVLKESQRRWQARKDGITDHQSPGLAESYWNPNTRFDGTVYSNENLARIESGQKVTAAPKSSGNSIPETAVDTCKQGIQLGMFTIAQMAGTYKMTEQEVKDQLGLD